MFCAISSMFLLLSTESEEHVSRKNYMLSSIRTVTQGYCTS